MAGQTGFKAGASDPRGITHIGHRDQLIDFVEAIDQGREPLVDGKEGRKSVEIIRAIYRAAETGTGREATTRGILKTRAGTALLFACGVGIAVIADQAVEIIHGVFFVR